MFWGLVGDPKKACYTSYVPRTALVPCEENKPWRVTASVTLRVPDLKRMTTVLDLTLESGVYSPVGTAKPMVYGSQF